MLSTAAQAEDVPSGQDVTLHEVLVDRQGEATWLRFRFLAPQIGREEGQVGFDVAGEDMLHLCDTLALPYMHEYTLTGDRIVISFMDRITEFSVPDPDATQFFEAFRPVDGACMWDEF
ncbi:hypothetical protein KDD17_03225 [Sulfitobacter albidus]|uniref:Acetolactate synthase n=1 Tax=Sulfitobacter albidus TaxID=2829501 RepID=A0A975PMU1_9RHOB|nr:DUF6497 family protein [Sulfitobacter albidus]QUJ77059.1 hypothetical protein KDD17_03225 [Sulfitobacter albidus]